MADSTLVAGEVAAAVEALKQDVGGDLHVIGSSELVRTLIEHELVDEFPDVRTGRVTAGVPWPS
jgi:dihydrofolate reductase